MDTSTRDQVNEATAISYARVGELIAHLTPEQLAAPTACGDWTVEDLLGHLAVNTDQIGRILDGEEPDWSAPAPADPATAIADAATANAARRAGSGDAEIMPGVAAVDMNLIEVVGHTWDLAQALGADVGLPDTTVRTALGAYERLPLDRMRGSSFGPVVDVSDDAPALDRLVGLLGRQP
jgi:uncharacterized protein (TIGR03086 family)